MKLNVSLLVGLLLLSSLRSFANPNLEEFLKLVKPSATYLDHRLQEHNCLALLSGGKVTVPGYPNQYTYFSYPVGPGLHHRYNRDESTKQDVYRFIIEPAFQSEFRQIISEAVASSFPEITMETKTGSNYLVDYDQVRITHVTNGNLDFNTVEFSFVAPPETLDQLQNSIRKGFPFR